MTQSTKNTEAQQKSAAQLLAVSNLVVSYQSNSDQPVRAVDGVSFSVDAGETLGIVGESGCGKSSLGLSMLRLFTDRNVAIDGEINFRGRDVLAMSNKELQNFRGRKMSMVLQDLTALNPVFSIGNQIVEALQCHEQHSQPRSNTQQLHAKSVSALEQVNISHPEQRLRDHPHQLSGGMRQRVAGAIAMACEPELLIADEPTTALDVTVQAAYLKLLKKIQNETGVAIMLISHDFGVVAALCDRICVMYAGQIVEQGKTTDIFNNPTHWYTWGLLNSRPTLHSTPKRLVSIEGAPPDLRNPPAGCRFADRCPNVQSQCRTEMPADVMVGEQHSVRCLFPREAT